MDLGVKTKVKCPKCNGIFAYSYIPGGSFSAVRLGPYRYMKCQKCGRWALFDITSGTDKRTRRQIGIGALVIGLALFVFSGGLTWFAVTRNTYALYIAAGIGFVLGVIMIWLSLLRIYGLRRTAKK